MSYGALGTTDTVNRANAQPQWLRIDRFEYRVRVEITLIAWIDALHAIGARTFCREPAVHERVAPELRLRWILNVRVHSPSLLDDTWGAFRNAATSARASSPRAAC